MAGQTLQFNVLGKGDASDLERLAYAVDRFADKLKDLDRQKAEPTVKVDTKQAERNVGQFATNLQRTISKAIDALPDIELDADATDAQREVARIRDELLAIADKRVGVDIDAATAQAEIGRLEQRLRALPDTDLDIGVRADVTTVLAQLAAVNQQTDRLDGRRVEITIDTNRSIGEAIVHVAALGRALSTLALPASAVAAAPQIASIGAAAVTAVGALGTLPAAGAAAALGIGTLTVGLQGLGDALDEDPAKAAEAIAKLAPAAREAATSIRGLAPAWNDLRLDVQQRLFEGVGQAIQRLGGNYLPILRTTMAGIATSFNDAGLRVAEFLNRGETVAQLRGAFTDLGRAVSNIAQAAAPLTAVFVDVLSVGADVLADITRGAGEAAREFAAFVRSARDTGQLAQWMRDGVEQVQQLGRVVRDAGVTLYNVFRGADEAGIGFFDTVERITTSMRAWTSSAEGSRVIADVFRTIRETVDLALPGLQALGRAVMDVVTRLSNSGTLQAAATAFSAIATQVAPLVTSMGNLASTVLPPLLSTLSALAPVIVPAAAALLSLRAAGTVAGVLQNFATRVGDVGRSFSGVEGGAGRFRGAIGGIAAAVGAGGPLGLALAAGGIALGLFADAQARAAQASAEHKARIEELKGTLDQVSGAVTQNTINQQAQELSTRRLADGSLTYLQAVQSLGISTQDYTQASLGNAGALERVRAQLDSSTASTISASREYQVLQGPLAAAGISMSDFTAAASGSQEATDKIRDAINNLNGTTPQYNQNLQMMFGRLMDNSGASAALAQELGITSGELARIQQEVRDAAEASGLLAQQLGEVKSQMDAVPDAKEITLTSTSPEVIAQLRELGFEVTTLKDGTVRVNLEDAEARARFDALMVTLSTATAAPTLDLNTATATQKADAVKAHIDGLVGIATADANAAPGTEKANGLKTHIDGIVGILAIDGNPAPGTEKANALQAHVDGLVGIMTQDGNNAPGTAKGDALREYINGLLGIMEAQANTDPGSQQGRDLKAYIDRLRAAITVDSNATQVNDAINYAARERTAKINLRYVGVMPAGAAGPRPVATGAILQAMHDGGLMGFARGGHATYNGHRLRPLRGGVAEMVPPNTWRVVGDRLKDDEAYIPINQSARSHAILATTARRMGRAVVPMANGGTARAAASGDWLSLSATAHGGMPGAANLSGLGASISGLRNAVTELRADLTQLGGPSFTNVFNGLATERTADKVAQVQRTQAALGLFGG